MTNEQRIFVAGHKGMVGSAINRELKKKAIKILLPDPALNSI
jgi:nucleoside-diphosphate-sugar epimerase